MDPIKIKLEQLPALVNATSPDPAKLQMLEAWALDLIDYDFLVPRLVRSNTLWPTLIPAERQAIVQKVNQALVRRYHGLIAGRGALSLTVGDGVGKAGQPMRYAGTLRLAGEPALRTVDVIATGSKVMDVAVGGNSLLSAAADDYRPVWGQDDHTLKTFLLK